MTDLTIFYILEDYRILETILMYDQLFKSSIADLWAYLWSYMVQIVALWKIKKYHGQI